MKVRGESQQEAVDPMESLASPKQTLRIGIWNVRTLFETTRIHQLVKEMQTYRLNILGISELRWTDSGTYTSTSGEKMIYSGRKDGIHEEGVGIIMDKTAKKCLMEWEPVNSRIMRARFYSKFAKCTVIQCYAPTEMATDEVKDEFYELLHDQLSKVPSHDVLIVMGDMNAKIGADNSDYRHCMGNQGIGLRNNNGERFLDMCLEHSLIVGGSIFKHKDIHKVTWISPDGRTANQIDHFAINKKWRTSLANVKVIRGANIDSDHHLVLCNLRLKLKSFKRKTIPMLFDSTKLKDPEIQTTFALGLTNRFNVLHEDSEIQSASINEHCSKIEEMFIGTSEEVLGHRERNRKPWISTHSWDLIDRRKKLWQQLLACKTRRKGELAKEYSDICKEVKRSTREDKRRYLDNKATEAQEAATNKDSRTLYKITRELSGMQAKTSATVRDKEGNILTTDEDQLKRWAEHFQTVLNRPEPEHTPNIVPSETEIEINMDPITIAEIQKAIKEAKSNKAPGEDRITADMLKANPQLSAKYLVDLFNRVWTEESVPQAWKNGVIIKIPKKGDLLECGNWRGINLLSIPGKIFCKVILHRIKNSLDKILREEQAGFRSGRSCTDQIFVMRTIIEQSKEWNSSLYINFIDFEKAFDSVHHASLWDILKAYGLPTKIINILTDMYRGNQCCVRHNNQQSEWFNVKSGVRQGCVISPFLFLLVIDWVMNQATKDKPRGITWNWTKRLEEEAFADDIALLSHTYNDIQEKSTRVENFAKSVGLKINHAKSKIMRINGKTDEAVLVGGHELEDVHEFKYLGSIMDDCSNIEKEIYARIAMASQAFQKMKNVWKSKNYSLPTKIRLYKSNVRSVLLYAAETWRTNKKIECRLRGFESRCLRRIMGIRWEERITNREIQQSTNLNTITEEIKKRRWRWLGHVLRMNPSRHSNMALNWTPQGNRKKGRPLGTWRRTIEEERKSQRKSWHELKRMAQDRQGWRLFIDALCSFSEP